MSGTVPFFSFLWKTSVIYAAFLPPSRRQSNFDHTKVFCDPPQRDTHRRWDQISPVFDPKCQFPEECWHYLSLLYLGQGKQLNLPHRRPAPLKFIMLFAILTKQYSQSGCETQARVHPDTEVKVNALEPAYLRLHTFLFPPHPQPLYVLSFLRNILCSCVHQQITLLYSK